MNLGLLTAAGRLDDTFLLPPDQPFTLAAAHAAGLSRHAVRTLLDRGLIRRVIKGVYAGSHLPDTIELRARSLLLVAPPDCVVVDRHAGWLLGAEMVLAPGEHIALRPLSLYRPAGHGRLRNKLASSGERNLRPDDVMEVHGLRVTTPLRTAWDLGRVRWTDEAISGLDAMFRLGAFERPEFLAGVERFKGMRWVTTLRVIGPLADPRSESPGESVLRLRCHECAVPLMTPQVEIFDAGRFVARLDLGNEEKKFGAEYDGVEWHSTPDQLAHDRDRRADAADLGWTIVSVRKENLFGQQRNVDQLLISAADGLRR
jgi:hypothetical protein